MERTRGIHIPKKYSLSNGEPLGASWSYVSWVSQPSSSFLFASVHQLSVFFFLKSHAGRSHTKNPRSIQCGAPKIMFSWFITAYNYNFTRVLDVFGSLWPYLDGVMFANWTLSSFRAPGSPISQLQVDKVVFEKGPKDAEACRVALGQLRRAEGERRFRHDPQNGFGQENISESWGQFASINLFSQEREKMQ